MRKIVNTTYMSLDGDITNMQRWHFDFFTESDECATAAHDLMFGSDALIMGRETYDGFSVAWSARAGTDEFADRMNAVKKYVVSNTLTDPTWTNTEVISRPDVVDQIRRLKEGEGGQILQYGFGAVSRLMLEHGLLDELVIWLHPVFSGQATAANLLYRDVAQTRFDLVGTDVHSTGMLLLTYRPR